MNRWDSRSSEEKEQEYQLTKKENKDTGRMNKILQWDIDTSPIVYQPLPTITKEG